MDRLDYVVLCPWRWIEHADENQVLVFAATPIMPVMLVKNIDVASADLKYIAVHIFDLAIVGDTVADFEVIAIFKQGYSIGSDDRVADCEAHPVLLGQQPVACAAAPFDRSDSPAGGMVRPSTVLAGETRRSAFAGCRKTGDRLRPVLTGSRPRRNCCK